MSARPLQIYFDYGSPFAYLASAVLPGFAREHGLALEWNPIPLQALSNFAEGLPYTPKKRAYVFVDAQRAFAYHGVAIRMPEPFPVQSAAALRVATAAQTTDIFEPLHDRLFAAAWKEARDISQESVLRECIETAGGDPGSLLELAATAQTEEHLIARTAQAEEAGVFGVPTMVLDGELFWGIDSLPVLSWRLRTQAR